MTTKLFAACFVQTRSPWRARSAWDQFLPWRLRAKRWTLHDWRAAP